MDAILTEFELLQYLWNKYTSVVQGGLAFVGNNPFKIFIFNKKIKNTPNICNTKKINISLRHF